ncbi:MAG: 50S ribosomal protein L10 [Candidatus Komeilibacteria bacterium CG_4_10_14_0_2_um_filter_37_10]|uniref:Large ribosomal subunit protein uL10 n=1 Tax=Candidatus Komeilibacteria bacterium CG_4_10_14_0_2_um_filter_37_10 TaxID=1974470 RepID=A0A2M7VEJ2_9BACT|nr:MAG: 50S ribosomal protein L10 [Candidatus Komeilibacteria bacterium CG_4_10_14_0_2_um_filter_37_10]PJA92709.1 MAG: 50S ribosomal protein L10 [Candidatus Komeilibacteria bacterium CG_4_9_14_3_um_filter_37_5]
MAKTKVQKQKELQLLKDKVGQAKSLIFTSYAGLSVAAVEELRKKFRQAGVEYQAAKKRLFDLALADQQLATTKIHDLTGSIAAAFSMDDEVSAAKIAQEFSKKNERLEIKSGLLKVDGTWKLLSAEEVKALANLPSKEQLLAKLVGTINAPVSGFVNVLAGNIRGLLYALKAIQEKK